MDAQNDTVTSGLQDWYTDLESWVCRFDARLSVSRSHKRVENENADFEHKCQIPVPGQKSTQTDTQRPEPVALQEFFVNGLLNAQKNNLSRNINKTDLLNILNNLKENECAHYDYALLAQVIENGRRHFYKSIRSKI